MWGISRMASWSCFYTPTSQMIRNLKNRKHINYRTASQKNYENKTIRKIIRTRCRIKKERKKERRKDEREDEIKK